MQQEMMRLKKRAKNLHKLLPEFVKEHATAISLMDCQNLVASLDGYPNWHAAQSKASVQAGAAKQSEFLTPGGVYHQAPLVLHAQEITSRAALMELGLDRVINQEIGLPSPWGIAVAALAAPSKECALLVLQNAVDESMLHQAVQAIYANERTLVKGPSQGYVVPATLFDGVWPNAQRGDVSRAESVLTNAVSWGLARRAQSMAVVVDPSSSMGKIGFNIDGFGVAPEQFSIGPDLGMSVLWFILGKAHSGVLEGADYLSVPLGDMWIEIPVPDASQPDGIRTIVLQGPSHPLREGQALILQLGISDPKADGKRTLSDLGFLTPQVEEIKRAFDDTAGLILVGGRAGSGRSSTVSAIAGLEWEDRKRRRRYAPKVLSIGRMTESGRLSVERAVHRTHFDYLAIDPLETKLQWNLLDNVVQRGHGGIATVGSTSLIDTLTRFARTAGSDWQPERPGFLKLVVHQELHRKLCPHCSTPAQDFIASHRGKSEDHAWLDTMRKQVGADGNFRVRNPQGCSHCRRADVPLVSGYTGMTVVASCISDRDVLDRFTLDRGNLEVARARLLSGAQGSIADGGITGRSTDDAILYAAMQGTIDAKSAWEHAKAAKR